MERCVSSLFLNLARVCLFSQIIGPLEFGELFEEEDFGLLEKYALGGGAQKIAKHIADSGIAPEDQQYRRTA